MLLKDFYWEIKSFRFLPAFFIFILSYAIFPLYAKADLDNDVGLWTPVSLELDLHQKWNVSVEAKPKFGNDISQLNYIDVKPLLSYKLNDNVTLSQGLGWIPGFHPNSHEYRIWQQAIIENRIQNTRVNNRFRLEERYFEGIGNPSIRGRYMLKFSHPVGKSKNWSLYIADEVLVKLNSLSEGSKSGFDQNRFYVGINRKINKNIKWELAYLLQFVNRRNPSLDQLNHIIVTGLSFKL